MKPVILLDIDGVLNPTVCPGSGGDRPLLRLSHEKRALVRRLARSGRIAWVSTWPADMVAGLEAQLGLDAEPLRVTMVFRPADADSPTPKLTSVTRWLYRMSATEESDWDDHSSGHQQEAASLELYRWTGAGASGFETVIR